MLSSLLFGKTGTKGTKPTSPSQLNQSRVTDVIFNNNSYHCDIHDGNIATISETSTSSKKTLNISGSNYNSYSNSKSKSKSKSKSILNSINNINSNNSSLSSLNKNRKSINPQKYNKNIKNNQKYIVKNSLLNKGYKLTKLISKTLQGSIYIGIHINTNKKVCIKITNKMLHENNITIKNNKQIKIKEDIISEKNIMLLIRNESKRLNLKIPKGITRFIAFFDDNINYYLIMQYGGNDFFKHILFGHEYITSNKLTNIEWKQHCKILFYQMAKLIQFLHTKLNICHLDISLENFVISGVKFNDKTGKFVKHGQVYLVDFGLSKQFNDTECKYNIRIGKTGYMAPKVYAKKAFNAKMADVWSLSMCLFKMIIGAPCYEKPIDSDALYYTIIKHKKLTKILKLWKRTNYVDCNIIDLFYKIWCNESKRININQILLHEYFDEIKTFKQNNINIIGEMDTNEYDNNSNNNRKYSYSSSVMKPYKKKVFKLK